MKFSLLRRVGLTVLLAVALAAVAAPGVWAATIKQLATPAGLALKITSWDANPTQGFEGYEVDLRIYNPSFNESITVLGTTSTILVVSGGKVTEIRTTQGTTLPSAPAIPADGYVVVGSGMASSFLTRFNIGDAVLFIEKESKATVPAPKTVITLSGASKDISAIDRGRMTKELIVYTPDFGSHTFTNQYGAEVVVVDGTITAKRPYNNADLLAIPQNGFVLSGHNVMGTWLDSLQIGDLVELQ